jgi:hypothetical protein
MSHENVITLFNTDDWEMLNKKKVLPQDMSTKHLSNTIKMLQRNFPVLLSMNDEELQHQARIYWLIKQEYATRF